MYVDDEDYYLFYMAALLDTFCELAVQVSKTITAFYVRTSLHVPPDIFLCLSVVSQLESSLQFNLNLNLTIGMFDLHQTRDHFTR